MAATTAKTNGANEWDKREVGCFWKREAKSNQSKYLSGVINLKALGPQFDRDIQVVGFPNKTKTKDTHPDIRIYISEKRTDAKPAAVPTAVPARTQKTVRPPAPAPVPEAEPEPDNTVVDNELL